MCIFENFHSQKVKYVYKKYPVLYFKVALNVFISFNDTDKKSNVNKETWGEELRT